MFGQAQAAVNMAFYLLRRGHFHRIDYLVPPGTFQLENATCAGQLVAMGRQIAELNENMDVVKKLFLDGQPVEPMRPWSDRPDSGRGKDREVASGSAGPAVGFPDTSGPEAS
jgi:hypothetical protein